FTEPNLKIFNRFIDNLVVNFDWESNYLIVFGEVVLEIANHSNLVFEFKVFLRVPVDLTGEFLIGKRLTKDFEVIFSDVLGQFVRQYLINLVNEYGFAEHLFDHTRRYFSLAKTFDVRFTVIVLYFFFYVGLIITFG